MKMTLLPILLFAAVSCRHQDRHTDDLIISGFLLASIPPPLETAASVNLGAYTGTWYEIASFPQFFSTDCHCTQATYGAVDAQTISVHNGCRRGSASGSFTEISGRAFVQPGSGGARLDVEFVFPFRAPYYILAVDESSYSLVGDPWRGSLFILSRSRSMSENRYASLTARAGVLGFDLSRLRTTDQSCP